MGDAPDTLQRWLEAAIAASGLKPTPFAQRAGIAPSTILRALAGGAEALTRRTIQKICDTYRLAPPGHATATGFAEPDLLPYTADATEPPLPANQYRRAVHSRALELAGYLPGDRVTFDMAARPAAGDAVEAQVYALDRAAAETVFRLYDPPYLTTRTLDPSVPQKPLLVDGERVRIAAVLIHMQRVLHRSAG